MCMYMICFLGQASLGSTSFSSGSVESVTQGTLLAQISDPNVSRQAASEVSEDVVNKSVAAKLSLLTLHFPGLRLLW